MKLRAELELDTRSACVPRARRFVTGLLDGFDAADDAALLVTELASNAVRHGRGALEVLVEVRPDVVRVAVHDEAPQPPPVPSPAPGDAEGGRGLWLVDLIAARWGTELMPPDGKSVWFELPLSGSSPSASSAQQLA